MRLRQITLAGLSLLALAGCGSTATATTSASSSVSPAAAATPTAATPSATPVPSASPSPALAQASATATLKGPATGTVAGSLKQAAAPDYAADCAALGAPGAPGAIQVNWGGSIGSTFFSIMVSYPNSDSKNGTYPLSGTAASATPPVPGITIADGAYPNQDEGNLWWSTSGTMTISNGGKSGHIVATATQTTAAVSVEGAKGPFAVNASWSC